MWRPAEYRERLILAPRVRSEMGSTPVLPRVMSFVVTPEQEELIEQAVELASDGTPGRDRKARGLANMARHFLKGRQDEAD